MPTLTPIVRWHGFAREPERLRDHWALRCPVRFVAGGTPHAGARPLRPRSPCWRERLRHVRRWTRPGAGHFVYEERPAAVVAAVERLSAELAARASPARNRLLTIRAIPAAKKARIRSCTRCGRGGTSRPSPFAASGPRGWTALHVPLLPVRLCAGS